MIYEIPSNEFRNQQVFSLNQYLNSSSLNEALKLMKLIIVKIPVSGDSVERSFSALKRMKTTLRSTQSHNKHARFSLITIEKRLLKTLKRVPFGYVIEVFNKKGRRIDLTYK